MDKLNMQVTVPSLASVYNEYALKSQYDTSIYLQVILYVLWFFLSQVFALGTSMSWSLKI